MGTGILSIGVSGIRAAQYGLMVTEHNVVNASTPGYTRQSTMQATNMSVYTGAGAFGQGVNVVTVSRMYDRFLTGQVNSAQTQVSYLDTMHKQLSQIDNMLADSKAGLSPALQSFFSGVQQVAANPSLIEGRQAMLTTSESLIGQFKNMDTRLTEMGAEIEGRITDTVEMINGFAEQIAHVNQRIMVAESGYGQPANDLRDQRDQMIAELNKLISVEAVTDSQGNFSVFIGSGQQLVVGGTSSELVAAPSRADSGRLALSIATAGTPIELPEKLITGGELGGLIEFRSKSLDSAKNELGRIAVSLSLTFNAQHSLGQNMLGQIEGDAGFIGNFFSVPDPRILTNSENQGSGSMSATFTAAQHNGNFYTDLTGSDYQLTFGAGGAYSIMRLSDKEVVSTGTGPGTATFDGIELAITATGDNGDRFLIKPTDEAARNIAMNATLASDPRLINAAAPMRTVPNQANSGAMTISQGEVSTGYSTVGLPLTLTVTAGNLSGLPGDWEVIYANGVTQTGTGGTIPLTNGAATLSKIIYQGMSFSVAGAPADGDSFTIERNAGGVQDGRNAVLLGKLQTATTMVGGQATFQSVYSSLVSANGVKTRSAKLGLESQEAVLKQATANRDAFSAVNLDEEAANLLKFQQAYQASAKSLQVGSQLFDTLLSIF